MKIPNADEVRSTRPRRLNRLQKALVVIEGMILATEPKDEMLRACYRFAHAGLGSCENLHTDWVRELNNTFRRLRRNGVV